MAAMAQDWLAQGRSRAKLFCETKEEAEHIPEGRRIPLLIASMGREVFEEAKKSERKTMRTLHRQRQQTVEQEESEWDQMPGSLKEARERAMKLASETEREAKRTWTAHRTPSRWGASDVPFRRPEGAAMVPEAWPEATAEAEPKPMASASPAAEKAPIVSPEPSVPSPVNVAKEPAEPAEPAEPDTVPEGVPADRQESPQEAVTRLLVDSPAVDVDPVNPCTTTSVEEAIPVAVEVKEDDPFQDAPVTEVQDPGPEVATPEPVVPITDEAPAAPEPAAPEAAPPEKAEPARALPSQELPSPPRPLKTPRWCDLSEASPEAREAKSLSFGAEEYHFPSHRQVLLKTEPLTPPPPPPVLRGEESAKDRTGDGVGNSLSQGKIAPSQAKARKSTREGSHINGRPSAEPKVWGRPKILQRQVRDEAEDAQQPLPLPAATVAPPAPPPRPARPSTPAVPVPPPPPVAREVPTPPTATSWLGSGDDPKIRILQRPGKAPAPAEEAEDSQDEEEEAPPVRRSWRCARAGKSERVVTARYKPEEWGVGPNAMALKEANTREVNGANGTSKGSKGLVSHQKGPSDREAELVPNRQLGNQFSKTVSQEGAAQAAQASQPLSSAAAWLGEQVPVSRDKKAPTKAAPAAPAAASQSWKPRLSHQILTERSAMKRHGLGTPEVVSSDLESSGKQPGQPGLVSMMPPNIQPYQVLLTHFYF
eukprot:s337_g5.t2